MTDEWPFDWPVYDSRPRSYMNDADWEAYLLEQFKKMPDHIFLLWDIVLFYRKTGRQEEERPFLERIRSRFNDPEQEASFWLRLGRWRAPHGYDQALEAFKQALPLEPQDKSVWYSVHNNIGNALVGLGKYREAEDYCSRAIKIKHDGYKAHMNLVIALECQCKYIEAAKCCINLTKLQHCNSFALQHLEHLMKEHPEILDDIPDIPKILARCREENQKRGDHGVEEREDDA